MTVVVVPAVNTLQNKGFNSFFSLYDINYQAVNTLQNKGFNSLSGLIKIVLIAVIPFKIRASTASAVSDWVLLKL